MKKLILGLLIVGLAGCAAKEVAKPAAPAAPAPAPVVKKEEPAKKVEAPKPVPVKIVAAPAMPPTLAEIDPVTFKVKYEKGIDPKLVVDQVVKEWAGVSVRLQQCEAALQQQPPKQ